MFLRVAPPLRAHAPTATAVKSADERSAEIRRAFEAEAERLLRRAVATLLSRRPPLTHTHILFC